MKAWLSSSRRMKPTKVKFLFRFGIAFTRM
jgi:hypothetical protein